MPKPRTIAEYKERQTQAEQLHHQALQRVAAWVAETFEPGTVTLAPEAMPGPPGATWVRDANGDELLVWHDVFSDCVRWGQVVTKGGEHDDETCCRPEAFGIDN